MPEKILVVEDDNDFSEILKAALEKNGGYEVVTALDGYAALKTLKTYVPDLMIVDLTMPVMTGWHFSMKVRQNERFAKTPIIVLSGMLERETSPEAHEPANAYMPKPFDLENLLGKIKELLKS